MDAQEALAALIRFEEQLEKAQAATQIEPIGLAQRHLGATPARHAQKIWVKAAQMLMAETGMGRFSGLPYAMLQALGNLDRGMVREPLDPADTDETRISIEDALDYEPRGEGAGPAVSPRPGTSDAHGRSGDDLRAAAAAVTVPLTASDHRPAQTYPERHCPAGRDAAVAHAPADRGRGDARQAGRVAARDAFGTLAQSSGALAPHVKPQRMCVLGLSS